MANRYYEIRYNRTEGVFRVIPDTHERELPKEGFVTAPKIGAAWCVEEKIEETVEVLRFQMLEEADEVIETARRFRERLANTEVIIFERKKEATRV